MVIFVLLLIECLQIIHYLNDKGKLSICIETLTSVLNHSGILSIEHELRGEKRLSLNNKIEIGPDTLTSVSNNNLVQYEIPSEHNPDQSGLATPVVYVVTPTYRRPTQKADLTRLAQTLMNLDFVFWIVVEDAEVGYQINMINLTIFLYVVN